MATPGTWQLFTYDGMQYELLLPDNYSPNQQYPLLTFLHGTGDETLLPGLIDPWFNTAAFRAAYPAIVIAPILPNSSTTNSWGGYPGDTVANSPGENQALAIVQNVMATYPVNRDQLYLTGISLGSVGAWDLMIKDNAYNGTEGRIFAAALTLAGGLYLTSTIPTDNNPTPAMAAQLADIPMWAIHGNDGDQHWDEAVAAALGTNTDFHYTENLSLGHDVWDTYYPLPAGAQFYNWLFSQSASSASLTLPAVTPTVKNETLSSESSQYTIADNGGSLFVQDSVPGRDGTQTLPGVNEMTFTNGIGIFDPTGTAEDVARLYQAILGRAPDPAGLLNWTAEVDEDHVSLAIVAQSMVNSPEFTAIYGNPSDAAFVNQLYENGFARAAEPAGLQFWEGLLASGTGRGTVALVIAESPESHTDSLPTAGDNDYAELYRLYGIAFNRVPDAPGEAAWLAVMNSGASIPQVAEDFTQSAEFLQHYGTLSVNDFITSLYENGLGRAPDAAGFQAWTNFMNNGGTEASALVDFSDSLEYRSDTAAATHANWVFIPT